MKTKEQILEDLFYKPETQDWYKPVLKAMEMYAQQLHQPLVSGTFCEKCNPNGIEDGNVIRCKKCGRGLALIEQNYH